MGWGDDLFPGHVIVILALCGIRGAGTPCGSSESCYGNGIWHEDASTDFFSFTIYFLLKTTQTSTKAKKSFHFGSACSCLNCFSL